jgi:hypothetical protein
MYLKIVPAPQLEAETHIIECIECERVEFKLVTGAAEEVHQEVERFLFPPCGPDDEPGKNILRVGFCRTVMEPGDGHIAAAMVTVHREKKEPLLVAAYECCVYLTNENGKTVDTVKARSKF